MTTRASAPAGAPCWVDLQTSDTERSRSFYTQLFGWTASEPSPEFGGYFMFERDGVPVAGCMKADEAAPVPDVWSVYLATDDATTTLEAVTAHGGQVVVPAMRVGDGGTMAFVVDTSGAGVGLWQPDQFPGLTVLSEPGTPSWFELLTRDFTAATAFYRDVFGWDLHVLSDTPEFRYQALRAPDGDGFLAGVMDAATLLPDGVPSYWGLYLGVEDAEAAVSRAVGLGASVVHAVKDTPYGRLAAIADPNGALITLVARTASGSATG